ncbi:hypothetical protein CFP56_022498 [Quercus suber]|uniref:Uncharacterized protein n=1 Tax=Quercus suber TaxID=58331 RepID=A0AAW0KB26_QUESU
MDTHCRSISMLMSLFLNWIFISMKYNSQGLVGWSSLKFLCIGYTALSEDVINEVLMGSPRLEFLKLKLVIDSCYSKCHEPIELEIVAPKIESLEILGNFYRKNDEEEEVRKDSVEVVSELFENLHQVKKLIVGKWCLKQYFMLFLTANVDYHLQRHECINII